MRPVHRRTAPGVRGGKPLRRNRTDLSPHYSQTDVSGLVIDRRRPGSGYRHVLTIDDVRRFLALLPDRDELLDGLRAIVLDEGSDEHLGWCDRHTVAVCAWERDLERFWHREFVAEHRGILHRLGVEQSEASGPYVRCRFTQASARGFLLMHILLHELGHCFAARSVEGDATDVLLWPLGGLAYCDLPHTPRAHLITAAGGPAVNVFLCIVAGGALAFSALIPPFNPFQSPYDLRLYDWAARRFDEERHALAA